MQYKVVYGIESLDREALTPPTVGSVKKDTVAKAVLGYGDNVRALIYGVEQPDNALVPEGAEVVLETKANSKAS